MKNADLDRIAKQSRAWGEFWDREINR